MRTFSVYKGDRKMAEGVVFTDGTVAVRWVTDTASTVVCFSFADFRGTTSMRIVWHDE